MNLAADVYHYVAEEESYPDQAVIVKEDGYGDWLYMILEGQAKVKRKTAKGVLTISTLKVGAVFGELHFMPAGERRRKVTVVADGPVVVGIVDSNQLNAAFAQLPPMMKKILSAMANRVDDAVDQLMVLAQ